MPIALLIQHATPLRHTVTSFMAPHSPPYFSTLSHKRCDFWKNVTERSRCVFIFCTAFIGYISHYKKKSAIYIHKCVNIFIYSTRYFCRIWMKLEFYRQIFEESLNIKCLQNPSSESRVVQCGPTDRRTGMTKLRVAFRNFGNASKKKAWQVAILWGVWLYSDTEL